MCLSLLFAVLQELAGRHPPLQELSGIYICFYVSLTLSISLFLSISLSSSGQFPHVEIAQRVCVCCVYLSLSLSLSFFIWAISTCGNCPTRVLCACVWSLFLSLFRYLFMCLSCLFAVLQELAGRHPPLQELSGIYLCFYVSLSLTLSIWLFLYISLSSSGQFTCFLILFFLFSLSILSFQSFLFYRFSLFLSFSISLYLALSLYYLSFFIWAISTCGNCPTRVRSFSLFSYSFSPCFYVYLSLSGSFSLSLFLHLGNFHMWKLPNACALFLPLFFSFFSNSLSFFPNSLYSNFSYSLFLSYLFYPFFSNASLSFYPFFSILSFSILFFQTLLYLS